MAFNENPAITRNKNQFVARMVSKKTGAMVNWVHITDDFARKVFGANIASEVTSKQAEETLPLLLNNDYVECVITDLTLERDPIKPTEF